VAALQRAGYAARAIGNPVQNLTSDAARHDLRPEDDGAFAALPDRRVRPWDPALPGAHVTVFRGGSHLTLVSHPDAVTQVIGQAICAVRGRARGDARP
jgi:hypothetical protein